MPTRLTRICSTRRNSPVAGARASSAIERLDPQQPRRPTAKIGQVDVFGNDGEVGPVDRLQIGKIVDQRHQMPSGRCYVVGVAGIVGAQRPFHLRADRIGIGDDPSQWLAQRPVQPLAELGRIERHHAVLRQRRQHHMVHREGRTPIADQLPGQIEEREARQAEQPPGIARLRGDLVAKGAALSQGAQQWHVAVIIGAKIEIGRKARAGRWRRGRQHPLRPIAAGGEFEPHVDVDLPGPSFRRGGKIGLPPLHFGRVEGSGALVPVDHGQRDSARFGSGAHPHVDQASLRRRDDGARYGRAEPLRRSHHRRQLRHGQRSAQIATGFALQIEQWRIRAEQPAFTRQGGPQDRRIGGWSHAGTPTRQGSL